MKPPPFWHAPQPFDDFLALSYNDGALRDKLHRLINEASLHNMEMHQLRTYGRVSSYLVRRPGPIKLSPADGSQTILSGIAQRDGELLFGQMAPALTAESARDLSNRVGTFTLLHADTQRIFISQDFLGCGIIFYYMSPDFAMFSNRYHLLLIFLAAIGHKGELDLTKVAATIFSNSTFFHQNVSHSMDIRGVKQLPLDQEVIVDATGWRVVSKRAVQRALAGDTSRAQRDLSQAGAEEVRQNVAAPFHAPFFNKVVVDLSGGMDSRAVLAAALGVPESQNRMEIRSKDVAGSRDLEIAIGLTNLVGGSYYSESGRPQYPISVEESLNVWRSYFMGTYHALGLTPWSPRGENRRELRLSGGCGEVYRTFWTKIYSRITGNVESDADLADRLVRQCAEGPKSHGTALMSITELLAEELSNQPGDTVIERFENHYLFFRNRYHFGMRAFETYHDSPMWLPLMSASLLAASRLQAPASRGNSLILELTERLHPLLVWIDYDSVRAADNEVLANMPLSDSRFRRFHVCLDSDPTLWKSIQEQNELRLRQSRIQMDEEYYRQWRESQSHVQDEARRALDDLRNALPEGEPWSALVTNAEAFLRNPRLTSRLFSKFCSLRDQLAIFA